MKMNERLNQASEDLRLIARVIDSTSMSMIALRNAFLWWSVIILLATATGLVPVFLLLPADLSYGDLFLRYAFRRAGVPGTPSLYFQYPWPILLRVIALIGIVVVASVTLRRERAWGLSRRIFIVWLIILAFNFLGASLQTPPSFGSGEKTLILKALLFPCVTVLMNTGFYQVQFFCFTFAIGLLVTTLFSRFRFPAYIALAYAVLGFGFQPLVGGLWTSVLTVVIIVNVLWVLPFPAMAVFLSIKSRSETKFEPARSS